ncbi:MAG: hypothetical protein IJU39_02200 [Clostridia bacterium]|nr:hypothetical protein [Clostridia bacterium]
MTNTYVEKLENWLIAKDEDNTGKDKGYCSSIPKNAVEITVPSVIQQAFEDYQGVAYYYCKIKPGKPARSTDRTVLEFMGVDYKAEVYLNGQLVAVHEGAEGPFSADITDVVKYNSENLITVRVLNPTDNEIEGLNIVNTPSRNKAVIPRPGASLNYGGLWYGVELLTVPGAYISDNFLTADFDSGVINARITVDSAEADCGGTLEMKVFEKVSGKLVGSVKNEISAPNGVSESEISFEVENRKEWHIEDPFLYRVEVTISTQYGEMTQSSNAGFRKFEVRDDGLFYLNNKKFFLRCSHLGNHFPVGFEVPTYPIMALEDIYYAKTCGFNMVRGIMGVLRPEQLDLCDEIGMLVYEESFGASCLGHNCVEKCEVGDEEAMLKRLENGFDQMILRDRSRTCVVAWGLLNEVPDNNVFKRAADYLPKLRELDKTRFVFLNSGRFDMHVEYGSGSNPFSDKWDNLWGFDGVDKKLTTVVSSSAGNGGDFHCYPTMPMDENNVNMLRTLGENSKPVYLSEFGTGSSWDVIDVKNNFLQRGLSLKLGDADFAAKQADKFAEDFEKLNLFDVFPCADMLLEEGTRLNGEYRYRDFNLVRSNPHYCGYSLTGLYDHGLVGEGLWTYFRKIKPEIFSAVCDGWEKLRFCLFVKPFFFGDETVTFEAVLANDGVLKSGKYTAIFAIMGKNGVVKSFNETFDVDENSLTAPIFKKDMTLNLPAGDYTFYATLKNASAAGKKLNFTVCDREQTEITTKKVSAFGVKDVTKEYLNNKGVEVIDSLEEGVSVLVGENIDDETLDMLLSHAKHGLKLIFLEPKLFVKDENRMKKLGISEDLGLWTYRDWLYHKECVVTKDPIFRGFDCGLVDYMRFGLTWPISSFVTSRTPDRVICPSFFVSFCDVAGGYALGHAISGFECGEGKIILNCFRIEENLLTEPAAGLLLKGIIDEA